MQIEVISPGLCTTLQDQGRFSFLDQGMPTSGFMDTNAAHLANLLLGNPGNNTLVEMMLVGMKFKVNEAISIAITGANMHPKVNGVSVELNKVIQVPADGVVSLSGARTGMYAYIAFSGVLEVPSVFKSTSTYLPAAIGGANGKRLEKGTVLKVNNSKCVAGNTKVKPTLYEHTIKVDCLKGPEWEHFSQKVQSQFLSTPYMVSKDSNRIGIRLEGSLLEMPLVNEIISSGIVKGTVQITKAGNPIVMMADAPTTGGYLRIVNLTEKAINQLAQLPLGGTVVFNLKEF